jgi:DNA-directed RNA polymerase subunit B"
VLNREVLSRAYFTKDNIVRHHIDSFNDFLEYGMQKVIDEQDIIETDIDDTYVKLGDIRVDKPVVKEADGAQDRLYPNDARLRNITYSAPIILEMTIVQGLTEKEPVKALIGHLPIMIMSKVCNLADMPREEMVKMGEDALDPGGYFIVNGTERVIMTLEDLAPNKILVENEERYGDNIEVAKVFSERRGYRALVVVERGRKSIVEVSFPSISGRLNFITLIRALGIETDEEIVNTVSSDPEIIKFMLENLEEAEVHTRQEAIEKVGNRVAASQTREYQVKRANYVIDRYLLPHLGNDPKHRLVKAQYLGRMAEACFELALGRRQPDDKDHYANKRLKLSGDLMEDLFRVSFNRLARDIKYQLERANMRNRDLNVITVVRADVLTERLGHPLATGNWVGGRAGVSQLLDRIDYMASLSHLRRVISPLSRAQPHFEARDLHPTQWGRICPSETPEGPNCGLVKNFAQLVEISTEVFDIKGLKQSLFMLDVEPVTLQTLDLEDTPGTYATELEAMDEAAEYGEGGLSFE